MKHLLLDNSVIVWELFHYAIPFFPFNSIAYKVCVGFVSKNESSLEAHLKASDNSRVSKLFPKPGKIVNFVANNVPAMVNKKNFIALI